MIFKLQQGVILNELNNSITNIVTLLNRAIPELGYQDIGIQIAAFSF